MTTHLDRVLRALAREGLDVRREGPTYSVRLHGNEDMPAAEVLLPDSLKLEAKALKQLANLAAVRHPDGGHVRHCCATPDFHPGDAGIAIGSVVETEGMVIPQAVGGDINCGMRLHVADLSLDQFLAKKDQFVKLLKGDYLLGTRDVAMTYAAMWGLFEAGLPLWSERVKEEPLGFLTKADLDQIQKEALEKVQYQGWCDGHPGWAPEALRPLEGVVRDDGLGTIGSGNHFVEVQVVEEIVDRHRAYAWGVRKGQIAIMIHSGSRLVGKYVGLLMHEKARAAWPKGLKYPASGIFPVSDRDELRDQYIQAENTASNYAFVNRALLAELARTRLREVFGDTEMPLVWDVPHNFSGFERSEDGKSRWICRKGACPAYAEQPVIIPGCFAAGTRILMATGLYKNIESIQPGDRVISGVGQPVTVRAAFSSGVKPTWQYKNNNFHAETKATADHLHFIGDFSSMKKARGVAGEKDPDSGKRRYGWTRTEAVDQRTRNGESKYKWLRLEELSTNLSSFMLLMPRHVDFADMPREFSVAREKWELTPTYELGYVFGTFLGDGSAYYTPKKGGQVTWTFGLDEECLAKKLSQALHTVFGLTAKVYFTSNMIMVVIHSAPFARTLTDFGKKALKALPEPLWCRNPRYLQGLYDGLVDSDGHLNSTEKFTNTSTYCIEQFGVIHYLLFGYFPSVSVRAPSAGGLKGCDVKHCNPSYRASSVRKPLLASKHQLIEMLKLTRKPTQLEVFDIEVDSDDHSFIANNAIVHNSMGTRSYLMVGLGDHRFLRSASHGAGRAQARGTMGRFVRDAAHASELGLDGVECITLREERRVEEAPTAYKDIKPVIQAQVEARTVDTVAILRPILTFKA